MKISNSDSIYIHFKPEHSIIIIILFIITFLRLHGYYRLFQKVLSNDGHSFVTTAFWETGAYREFPLHFLVLFLVIG